MAITNLPAATKKLGDDPDYLALLNRTGDVDTAATAAEAARDAALAAVTPIAAEQDASANAADVDLLAVARLGLIAVNFRDDIDGSLMRMERFIMTDTLLQVNFEGTGDMAGTVVVFQENPRQAELPTLMRASATGTSDLSFLRFNWPLLATKSAYYGRTIANSLNPGVKLNPLHVNHRAVTTFVDELVATQPYDRAALQGLVERDVVVRTNKVLNGAGDVQSQTITWPDGYQAASGSTFDQNGRMTLVRVPYNRYGLATTGTDILIADVTPEAASPTWRYFTVDTGGAVPS